MKHYKEEAKIFKMLMHPARLAILQLLRSGEECVCHMEAVLGYRQAYISQHLSAMKEAGLVQGRKEGWNSYYRVIQPEVFEIIDQAMVMTGKGKKMPARKFSANQVLPTCACPKCAIKA
jgi:DNA-binding transcriptional ArsR family regulator